ncbi:enoyl-CoA hydratase/isomerase family protein [Microbacterium sp. AGC85]
MRVLRSERIEAIERLTLARPEDGNALDLPLARELRDFAARVSADDTCAAVLIDADGELFCGGGDLAAMAAADSPADYVRELAGTVHEALLTIAGSDKVIVAAVQGTAAGGGLGLVLNCDYAVAAEGASFVSAYSRVGLSPDCGVSYLLPRLVGPKRAAELVFAGRVLDAATASQWGIVNVVEPREDVSEVALRAASRAAAMPSAARAASKRLLTASWLPGYAEHLGRERDSIAELAATAEAVSLRTAFLDRGR